MNTTFDDREALDRLLARAARHDERAFEELYRRTSARLFGICVGMLADRAEAEDALQEAFAAAPAGARASGSVAAVQMAPRYHASV